VAAERTGFSEVQSAKAKLMAAQAAIDQAQADAVETRAALEVVEARLDKEKVNLDYAKIIAPFDGVVTHRTFHPGALIRSATEGGQPQPLLTVKRVDVMRASCWSPTATLSESGRPAVVSVDALEGQSFTGTSRGSLDRKTPSG
jgi:multidrug resistance efflux pump